MEWLGAILPFALFALICPLIRFIMMRGMHGGHGNQPNAPHKDALDSREDRDAEFRLLRAERDSLRRQLANPAVSAPGGMEEDEQTSWTPASNGKRPLS